MNWHPSVHLLLRMASSVGSLLKPAGLDKSNGVISAAFLKDISDPQWKGDKEVAEWNAWMDKHLPGTDKNDLNSVYGYAIRYTLLKVLEQAGKDISRENIMTQAANLKNVRAPMRLPGIFRIPPSRISSRWSRCSCFNGERWELFGDVINGHI